jgi:putative transposase
VKTAAAKVLKSTWQRCRVHFLRNALAYAGKDQRQIVLAMINTALAQDEAKAAKAQWRTVAHQLRAKFPKLAVLMDDAEIDVLAFMGFPKAHRGYMQLEGLQALSDNKPARLLAVGCRLSAVVN